MKAELYKIDPWKKSRNGMNWFVRAYFRLENGEWAATDLVREYRNYARWRPILQAGIGTVIEGTFLMKKDKINADSVVKIFQLPVKQVNQVNLFPQT